MIFLLGCTFGLTDPSGQLPGGEDVSLAILDIQPDWGDPDRDTEVTITGDKIGGAVEVYFGFQSVSFTRIDATTVVATAPGPGFETTVDVRVVGDAGSDTVTNGFRYTTDGGGDADTDADSDTDTDTDTSGAGKTGGYLELSLIQYTCPQCYKDPPAETDVYAVGVFHTPKSASWLDWFPAEGDCVSDPSPESAANAFEDAGSRIYLDSGSRSLALQADASNVYSATGLTASDFVRNAGYDLSVGTGGTDIDAFDVPDALTTPEALSSVTPAELLLTGDRDLFTARITKSNAAFTWSPSGGSGSFAVGISAYNGSTGDYLGSTLCLGPDNGRLTVPASEIPWPAGSLLFVDMYRYNFGSFERPDNASSVETLVRLGVQGTGSLF